MLCLLLLVGTSMPSSDRALNVGIDAKRKADAGSRDNAENKGSRLGASFSDREDNDLVRRVGGRSNRLDQESFRGLHPLSRTSGMSISLQRGLLIYILCSLA